MTYFVQPHNDEYIYFIDNGRAAELAIRIDCGYIDENDNRIVEEGNASFNIDYSEELTICQRLNDLYVTVPRNYDCEYVNYFIECVHTNDLNAKIEILIVQACDEFSVKIVEDENNYKQSEEIEFQQFPKETMQGLETKTFTIKVSGGSRKVMVESLREYMENNDENNTISYLTYDNGLNYEIAKVDDNSFVATYEIRFLNAGIPFLNENNFYKIVFSHYDKPTIPQTIYDIQSKTWEDNEDYETEVENLSCSFTIRYKDGNSVEPTFYDENGVEIGEYEDGLENTVMFDFNGGIKQYSLNVPYQEADSNDIAYVENNLTVKYIDVDGNEVEEPDWFSYDLRPLVFEVACDTLTESGNKEGYLAVYYGEEEYRRIRVLQNEFNNFRIIAPEYFSVKVHKDNGSRNVRKFIGEGTFEIKVYNIDKEVNIEYHSYDSGTSNNSNNAEETITPNLNEKSDYGFYKIYEVNVNVEITTGESGTVYKEYGEFVLMLDDVPMATVIFNTEVDENELTEEIVINFDTVYDGESDEVMYLPAYFDERTDKRQITVTQLANNHNIMLGNTPSWLHIKKKRQKKDFILTITADNNTSNDQRSCQLIIYNSSLPSNNKTVSITQRCNKDEYLTFKVEIGGDIIIVNTEGNNVTVDYRKLQSQNFVTLTSGESIKVVKGDILQFKNIQNTQNTTTSFTYFKGSARVIIYGNLYSLINDNFRNDTDISNTPYVFKGLFCNCITPATYWEMGEQLPSGVKVGDIKTEMVTDEGIVTNAELLYIGANILSESCYEDMFRGCIALNSAPKLPAATLSEKCYKNMFRDCSALTNIPELTASVLAESCYEGMFKNCTSIIQTMTLSAPLLTEKCYKEMFMGCTSLTAVKLIAATKMAKACCYAMFQDCVNLITLPSLNAMKLEVECYKYMFKGCTSIQKSPLLPAKIIYGSCYEAMFMNCTSLTEITTLPATTVFKYSYGDMFNGCTSLVTGPALPANVLNDYCYTRMFANCTSMIEAPVLNVTSFAEPKREEIIELENEGLNGNVGNRNEVRSLRPDSGDIVPYTPKPDGRLTPIPYPDWNGSDSSVTGSTHPSITGTHILVTGGYNWKWCYASMFEGCTSLKRTPDLNATELSEGCYYRMFKDCTSLTYASPLPSTELITITDQPLTGSIQPAITGEPIKYKKEQCYRGMFSGCTSLKDGPALPARHVDDAVYADMFNGCSQLKYINAVLSFTSSELPISGDTPSVSGEQLPRPTTDWVLGVTGEGVFVKGTHTNLVRGKNGIPEKWVVYDEQNFNSPLKFTAINGTVSISIGSMNHLVKTIQYSTNNGNTWNEVSTGGVNVTQIASISSGTNENTLLIKGDNSTYCNGKNYTYFTCNGNEGAEVELSGNLMSLLDSENFTNMKMVNNSYTFAHLFRGCEHITSIENLIFPIDLVMDYSCLQMFQNCTDLVRGPQILPATTLANGCYSEMFSGCTSLTNAPILPAEELSPNCYDRMFKGCTSLTESPRLGAKRLVKGCYNGMFEDCENLQTIEALFTTTPSKYYTNNWVNGVSVTGTFVKSSENEASIKSNYSIPEEWETDVIDW